MFKELRAWLENNDPDAMPYWPGATMGQRVGIRTSQMVLDRGGNPLHAGVDRRDAGAAKDFTVPFDGTLTWTLLDPRSAAGSILQIKADGVDLELQVFHTEHDDTNVDTLETRVFKGEIMPVRPGSLGLSTGDHLHTEVLTPYDEDLRAWMLESAETIINVDGETNQDSVIVHCGEHNLDVRQVAEKIWSQVREWAIEEMTTLYMVRRHVPGYRQPTWGAGRTMHIDSRWLLKI